MLRVKSVADADASVVTNDGLMIANATQPAGAIRTISGFFDDAVLTPDGKSVLVSVHGGGGVEKIDLATGAVTATYQFGTTLGGMDVTPDGHYLIATERAVTASTTAPTNIDVYRLDLTTGSVATFQTTTGAYNLGFYDVATTSDGKAILTQDFGGSGFVPLTTLDIASGTFTTSTESYAQDGVLTTSGDHSHILFGPENISDAPLFIYTAGQGVTASHQLYQDNVSGFNRGIQAISATGRFVVQDIGPINVYDGNLHYSTNIAALHPEFAGQAIVGMAFSPDEHSLYMLDPTAGVVYQLSTADWSVESAIPYGVTTDSMASDYGDRLSISADGRYMTVIANASLQIIDLNHVVAQTNLEGDNVLTGGAGADVLSGFDGNDTLDGGAGADTLYGGAGNDTYFVDNSGDQVIEQANQGFDTVYTSVSMTMPANVEQLIGTGHDAISLTGSAGNDIITGNDADNVIMGGAGIDTLTGGGGHDVFAGSADDLAFDTITDLQVGDSIQIYQDPSTTEFTRIGDRLDYGNGRYINLPNGLDGRIVFGDSSSTLLTVANHDAKISDFAGDGHSDVLFHNVDGALSVWSVGGAFTGSDVQQNSYFAQVDTSWHIVETGDFDGDGRSDILWRNDNGTFSIWNATDDGFRPGSYTDGSVGNEWRIAGVGDFNGDGKDDLIWQRNDGAISTWQSTSSGFAENSYFHGSAGSGWSIAGVGDFNGDGHADLLWRNVDGSVSTWLGSSTGFQENSYYATVDAGWHIAGLGDLNGDGKEDIVWERDSGDANNPIHEISLWMSNGTGFDQNAFYQTGHESVAQVGDFNADGHADLLVNSEGTLFYLSFEPSTLPTGGYQIADTTVVGTPAGGGWSVVQHDYHAFG